jgi:hypothetical protein
VVDSSKAKESQFDRTVLARVVIVHFASPPSLVRVVLRRRYSLFARFHRATVEGVQEPHILRIHTIALVPMFLSDLSCPNCMHPAVSRRSENGLFVTFSHDRLIGSRILLLLIAASVVLECSPCVVNSEVVIWVSNFITVVAVADGPYLAVGLSVAAAFVDVVFVCPVV